MALPRVPRRGEKVQVDGREGTFIVVRVDKVEGLASLELWDDPSFSLRSIPFSAVHRITEDVNQLPVRDATEK
jgi:hypothetical protein